MVANGLDDADIVVDRAIGGPDFDGSQVHVVKSHDGTRQYQGRIRENPHDIAVILSLHFSERASCTARRTPENRRKPCEGRRAKKIHPEHGLAQFDFCRFKPLFRPGAAVAKMPVTPSDRQGFGPLRAGDERASSSWSQAVQQDLPEGAAEFREGHAMTGNRKNLLEPQPATHRVIASENVTSRLPSQSTTRTRRILGRQLRVQVPYHWIQAEQARGDSQYRVPAPTAVSSPSGDRSVLPEMWSRCFIDPYRSRSPSWGSGSIRW